MGALVALALVLSGGIASESGAVPPSPAPRVPSGAERPSRLRDPRLVPRRSPRGGILPAPRNAAPPRTPEGLPRCTHVLRPVVDLPRREGETIRYLVEIDGIGVGTVDFKIQRRGTYEGLAVTEYRSLFELDGLLSAFLPVAGRAAALVPDGGFWPRKAMNRYRLDRAQLEENVTYTAGGKEVEVRRVRNGKESRVRRIFGEPAPDFVSGFYLLRSLPAGAAGCVLLYGNLRAYTVWLEPRGRERVTTPVGPRLADRYAIRYASDRSRRPIDATVWIGVDPARLPYRAEIGGKHRLEARIHLYETGRGTGAAP